MATLPKIDPRKPVSGNGAGTFAGFVATLATGWVANHGWFTSLAAYFCVTTEDGVSFASCDQIEMAIMLMFAAGVGSAVNFVTTHYAQASKLKKLWDSLPEVRAEYPEEKRSESVGPENGNYNKKTPAK